MTDSREDAALSLQPLTAALLECVSPADVVDAVIERGVEALHAEAGLVVLVRNDALEIVGARGYAGEVTAAWNRFPLSASLPLSDAVRENAPLFFTGRADMEARYPAVFAQKPTHDVKASVTLPLTARGRAFGGLHFSFPQERAAFTPTDRAFVLELARQCALALDRALLLAEVEQARRHQEFLAQASAMLAESLDYQATLDQIVRLAVPDLCDWAAIDMVDPDDEQGPLLSLSVAHADPAQVAWVREARARYPIERTQTGQPVVHAIATGETVFLPDIPEEVLLAAARDEEHLRLIRRLDLRSFLCVPLIARRSKLGAVTFASTRSSGRMPFTPETVALVEELARRAAGAVVNALLFRAAQESEERFRALADNIAQLAWMADGSGAIFWYNRRWFEYTGTTLDEMQGWGWQKVHDPDYVERVTEKFRAHVRTGEPWEDTFPLRGADGRFRWFLSRAVPTRDAAGDVVLWCGTNTDITEQREAGARQRRFLREMLLGFTDGRLHLCDTRADLPEPLPALSDAVDLSAPLALRLLRKGLGAVAKGLDLPKERLEDFVSATHEAAMNALQHGRSGDERALARIHGDRTTGRLQVWVTDHGPGIAEDMIHRAVEQGFTTGGFGQGFYLMRSCADRLWLLTGPMGTTVVMEMERTPPAPAWLQGVR